MATVSAGDTLRFDVLVVGAGVAGLVAALDLLDARPQLSVGVVDKGALGSSGSTPLAQGGMAAAVGPDDSPDLHAADTIRAGDGLSDRRAVAVMTVEGPDRVADLVRRGARFDREPGGGFSLAREGGQRVARSVRTADATGAEIFRALRTAATGRLTRLQGVGVALVTDERRAERPVRGLWALLDAVDASPAGPAQSGGLVLVEADAVVLATGGCGGLFAATTNRDGATADGVALAWAAGAELVDMEFVQFHPTGLRPRDAALDGALAEGSPFWRLLLTEALRGAGAVLVDDRGQRFLPQRHPDAELAPRHIVAKAILDQPGGAWLDARSIGADVLRTEFPTVVEGCRHAGFDLAAEPVPVEPCQHYMVGGVATDLWARTSVPGLWAVGEVASTGVHGANRMAGNSLLQSCVFGHRAAQDIVATLDRAGSRPSAPGDPAAPALAGPSEPASAEAAVALRANLRAAMTHGAGAVRTAAGLDGVREALEPIARALPDPLPGEREWLELRNAVTVAGLIVRSALLREESRGVHWRADHPAGSPLWADVRLRLAPPA